LAAIIQAGCDMVPIPEWPAMPSKGLCRNFALTTWGGGAPWDEIKWGSRGDVTHIDEPMLDRWGWPGSYDSAEDVCGAKGLGMVRGRIAKARAARPGVPVWLNWSTDEIEAISRHCPGETWHQGADVFSFDSYGGLWDWPVKTKWLLGMFWEHATPEHRLGLVPEAFRETGGADYSQIDMVQLAHLYFSWAFAHDDGRVFAVAPFRYGPCGSPDKIDVCMADMPQVAEVWAAFAREYPRCPQ
jgi:hypothetical protein